MTLNEYKQYKKAEQYFESLSNLTNESFHRGNADPKHFFRRAKLFLKLAGQPDKAFKIIHVAGTSGKGSTVNYISKILQNAGYKVGTHFSPFVSVATEKIQVNGRFIPVKDFINLVEEIKPIIKKIYQQFDSPSYFECWMLAALIYFKKQKVDYAVIETGCGGRYDASNAVLKTEYSIITNVGLDHMHMLGNTVEKIAYEKAGIIRSKGKVITAATQPSVLNVIRKVCYEKNADLEILQNQKNPNQGLAIQVAQHLGIDDKIIEKSLKQFKLPARFEIMQKNPLVILDGAHNPDKIKYLANKLINSKLKYDKLHLVCALTDKKSPIKTFKVLQPLADYAYATRFLTAFRKCTPPLEIKKAFKNKPGQIFLDPHHAWQAAFKKANKNDIILITGSFFLCSDLRTRWISEEWQLENRISFK